MRLLDGDEPDESSGRESASSALEKSLCSGRATWRSGRQFAESPEQSGVCHGVTPSCVVAAAHRFGGRRVDGVVGLLQVRERSATPGIEPRVRRPRRGGTACRTGSGVAGSSAWESSSAMMDTRAIEGWLSGTPSPRALRGGVRHVLQDESVLWGIENAREGSVGEGEGGGRHTASRAMQLCSASAWESRYRRWRRRWRRGCPDTLVRE